MACKIFFLITLLNVISKEEKKILQKLGSKLRKKRLAMDMSQAQVAFELNTSTRHYQRIEYGEINTGILSIYKLADILNSEPKDLIS